MKCRLADFTTKPLPLETKRPEAPAWILDNAFECLMWIVGMVDQHHHLLNEEDLFYERPVDVDAKARLPIDAEEEEEAQHIQNYSRGS